MKIKAVFMGIMFLPINIAYASYVISLDCTYEAKKNRKISIQLDVDMKQETAEVTKGDSFKVLPVTISPTKITVGNNKDIVKGGVYTISRESLAFTYEYDARRFGSGKNEGTCELVTREVKNKF